ncbi:MAG TPA: hypothetical protein VFJ51_10435 [Nitrososphaeraceae archaeon]|nr:hypothetical protein [Nitrososphaeraceae archaeon]
MTSLKNKVKHAADKAKTNMKSAGKKDNDTAPRDTEGITRGDVAAGATAVVEKEEQKERA